MASVVGLDSRIFGPSPPVVLLASSSASSNSMTTTRPKTALSLASGTIGGGGPAPTLLSDVYQHHQQKLQQHTHHQHQQHQHQRCALSTLESSGNENNQRMTSMQAARFGQQRSASSGTLASSTTGGSGIMVSLLEQRDVATSSSSTAADAGGGGMWSKSDVVEQQQLQQTRRPLASSSSSSSNKPAVAQQPPVVVSTAAAASSKDDVHGDGSASIVIEEKRQRPSNGNGADGGYTYHRYLRGRLLGKGGFAKVYLCTAMDTGKNYAVKIVPKANLVKTRARQKLQAEIKIHRTLKHKHVCEYKHFFEDRDNCYILLELCHNQSLNEMIKRRKRLTEPEASYLIKQLLESVQYIHNENVIHRDLKLGNLFIDRNLNVKVGDFGLATRLEDKNEKRKTICGTPNYIAPEVIQNDKAKRGHSFEVDVWSMGVILYTILIGKPPYEARDVKATYQRILNNEYSFPSHVPISDQSRDLIESMLQSDPKHRPSLELIASHPFLNESRIPASLPMAALHSAPTWRFDEDGRFVAEEDEATRRTRKGAPPRSASRRQPFGSHDPNSAKPTASSSLALKKEKVATSTTTETGTSDMQRFVKNVLAIPSGQKSAIKPSLLPSTAAPTPVSSASPAGFKIFDESSSKRTPCSIHKPPVSPKSYHHATSTEELIARTKALTVSKQLRRSGNELARSTSTTASSACSNVETEAEILQRMVDRLDTVLEVVETRRSQYRPRTPRATAPTNSLPVWVTRYVDYTSKYGLGFLLSDGSSGVYFNDSTKTALEAGGDTFQYVERKKNDLVDSRRGEVQVTNYTLTEFPDTLNKKVTLLKHFRNYLMEQHKQADEHFPSPPSSDSTQPGHKFVYLKKWMRTKHAILFRLSNQTVQVVFYDQTEVLLTPDDRYITYVDKNHNRATYNFTDDVIGTFPELEKRIKYSRDIMHQLLAGQRQSIEAGVGAAALVR